MKRTPRKILINKLDKLWSLVVRKKYPVCIVCGKPSEHAHHAITRKAQSMGVRWMVENGVGLCCRCHIYRLHGQQGDKQFLDDYICKVNALITREVQENIHQVGHQVNKISLSDMEDMVTEFELILEGRL